jgi:cell division protein FtsQ
MSRSDRIRPNRKVRRIRRKKAGKFRAWAGRIGKRALSLAVLASLTLLGFTAYQYFQRSVPLNVGEVSIMGCMNIAESELVSLANVDFKASLANLDLRQISNQLAKHPWVEKAKVRRDWSRRALIIEVQERIPQALILLDDLYLVDRHGEVFKKAEPRDQMDFPILTGLDTHEVMERDPQAVNLVGQALEFLGILGQRKIFTPRDVSEIRLSKQNGLTIFTLKGGVPIRLGSGGLADKIDRLEKVLPDLQPKIKEVEYVELIYPRKVVVKMRTPDKENSGKS